MRIISYYEVWGKKDKADEWRKSDSPIHHKELLHDFRYDGPCDVRQPEIPARIPVGKPLMVEPHECQERGMQVVRTYRPSTALMPYSSVVPYEKPFLTP